MSNNKRQLKLAIRLHGIFNANRRKGPFDALSSWIRTLKDEWEGVDRNLRLVAEAIQRNWSAAARERLNEGRFCREGLLDHLNRLSESIESVLNPKVSHCSVTSIKDDLVDLEEAFTELKADKHEIWVQTEPITLEGIYLGAFEIRLPIKCLGASGTNHDFRVVALDPHPSAKREDVTHPHVESNCLCTGDATSPIACALEDGRLLDFFQLVNAVLTNYNPDSPYVKLENWEDQAIECDDCGYETNDDECSSCECCGQVFCQECSYYCDPCCSSVCRRCSTCCPGCEDRYCARCLSKCTHCDAERCNACLDDKDLCPDCAEQQAQEGKNDDNDSTKRSEGGVDASEVANEGLGSPVPVTTGQAIGP